MTSNRLGNYPDSSGRVERLSVNCTKINIKLGCRNRSYRAEISQAFLFICNIMI